MGDTDLSERIQGISNSNLLACSKPSSLRNDTLRNKDERNAVHNIRHVPVSLSSCLTSALLSHLEANRASGLEVVAVGLLARFLPPTRVARRFAGCMPLTILLRAGCEGPTTTARKMSSSAVSRVIPSVSCPGGPVSFKLSSTSRSSS